MEKFLDVISRYVSEPYSSNWSGVKTSLHERIAAVATIAFQVYALSMRLRLTGRIDVTRSSHQIYVSDEVEAVYAESAKAARPELNVRFGVGIMVAPSKVS